MTVKEGNVNVMDQMNEKIFFLINEEEKKK